MNKNRKIFIWVFLFLLFLYMDANTQGPTSPNFNSFTPVGNNEIVNQFNGQLNYSIPIVNVPGPNGSGFQMALTYSSNAKPNVQASWVGFGWELSPGAINRINKGFPDDYNSTNVIYWDKFRKNITAEKNIMARVELYSKDSEDNDEDEEEPCPEDEDEDEAKAKLSIGLGITSTTRYNNFENYSSNTTLGATSLYGGISASWTQKSIPTWIPNVNLSNVLNIKELGLEDLGEDETLQNIVSPILRVANIYPSTNLYFFLKDNGRGQFPSSLKEYRGTERSFRPTVNFKTGLTKVEAEPGFTFTERIIKPKYNTGKEKKVFGYIYSKNATKSSDMMDYYLEMNTTYDKRDNTLPIPFSNADNFYVTGQGINGSFRFWNSGIGIFRPESVSNEIEVDEIGMALGAGFVPDPEVNVGMDYGFGGQSKSVNKSHISTIEKTFKFDNSSGDNKNIKSSFASFNNDLGGGINPYYSSNIENHHKVETFGLSDNLIFDANPLSFNHSGLNFHMDSKVKQSKNISFNTFGDLNNDSLGINLFSYRSKNLKELRRLNRNLIAEYKIVNEEGKRFNYSLPVFSRNEKTLSYGITKLEKGDGTITPSTINNKIVYHHITPKIDPNNNDSPPEVILGHEMNEPYANSYLLTEILSPDYIDLKNDGPTIDDYGTYTEFHYKRTAGSKNKHSNISQDWASPPSSQDYDTNDNNWYKWRTPYNGLNYNKGAHSDPRDNMISMSRGEKEIYYLEAINTKTHLSLFITNKDTILYKRLVKGTNNFVSDTIFGDFDNRNDGYEAVHNEYEASGDPDATMAYVENDNKLRYLDKIILFKLDESNPFEYSNSGKKIFRVTEQIQTTKFEYDYSTWNGEPNSITGNGKLTLKKVWVENGNVSNELYSPYKFDYTYSQEDLPSYITDYNENAVGVELKEDPDYNVLDVDRWGNYRPNNIDDEGRTQNERAWVYQNSKDSMFTDVTPYEYDPSAHLLKKVTLPSRGKILVDYEENEYSYVQDRPAMIMSRLKENSYNPLASEMILDISKDLGIDLINEVELVDSIVQKVQDYYVGTDRRIYFKFFYAIVGGSATNSLEYCSNEYIEGYARVESCFKNSSDELVIKFEREDDDFVPKIICDEFYYNKRFGAFDPNPSVDQPCCDVINGTQDAFEYDYLNYENLKGKLGYSFLPGDASSWFDEFKCLTINEELSYIRIPLPSNIPKKGGGVRVKRVLYVDGFEKEVYGSSADNLRVYGNEYLYQDTSGNGSGIATNEPMEGGEENSLVDLTKKRVEDKKSYVAGDFMEEIEGPYGKTILPSAAINYSTVIKKNISNYETHPGFQINNYLTYKDYPYDGILNDEIDLHDIDMLSNIIQSGNNRKRPLKGLEFTEQIDGRTREIKRPLNLGASNSNVDPCAFGKSSIGLNFGGFTEDYVKTTQGTQFVTTNLIGKLKESITYGGRYDNTDTWSKGKGVEYDYFKPGEKQPIVYEDFKIHEGYLGREIEIVLENRRIDEKVNHYKPEIDLGFVWKPPFFDEAQGNISYRGSKMRYEHMLTNKIISYPAIVKKVKNTLDGVTTITENIGFDQYTGRPILTKSATKYAENLASDYNIKSLNIPATYIHPELSQKSLGTSSPLKISNNNKMGLFRKKMVNEDNDTLYILSFDVFWDNADRYKIVEHLSKGALIKVSPTGDYNGLNSMSEYYRVIDVFNDYAQIVPIYDVGYSNAAGLPPSSMLCKVEIIESGNTNQLTTSIGNINFVSGGNDGIPRDKVYLYSDEYLYEPAPSEGTVTEVKNLFAEAINDKIEDILEFINLNASYNSDVRIDNKYIRYSDSTISVTLPDDGIEIFDINGDLDTLKSADFQTGTSRLYISDFMIHKDPLGIPLTYTILDKPSTSGYDSEQIFSQARNDFYVYYTFDLVFERLGEESSIPITGRKYHPYPAALNEIFDNAWSLEITDILENNSIEIDKSNGYTSQNFPFVNEVNENIFGYLGLTGFTSLFNFSISGISWTTFEESKNVKNAWKDIYERIGLRDLYKIKVPIVGVGGLDYNGSRNLGYIDSDYIGEYSDLSSTLRDLSIITYYDNEEGRYKSYLSRFLLNIKDPTNPENNSINVGFKRNFQSDSLQSGYYTPFSTEPTPNQSKFEIIAGSNIKEIELMNDVVSFIDSVESDYKFSRDFVEFILDSNKLKIDFKETSNIITTSSKFYYPDVRYRDECRRTYNMTMPQEAANQPAHTDPNTLNQDYFIIHEGKLMRNHISPRPGFQEIGDFDYDMVNDTIGEYLFGSTEANYFCLHFNPMEEEIYSFDDVLSSSVVSISDNWELDTTTTIEGFNPKDPYRNGSLGRWGLQEQIGYRDNIEYASGLATTGRNTKDNNSSINFHTQYANESIGNGDYNNFIMYNWKNNRVNDTLRWIKQTQITDRSKDFQVTESKDILNIYNSVNYDDSGIRPTIVSQNASSDEIVYNSFDYYNDETRFKPHSGNNTFPLHNSVSQEIERIVINPENEYVIKLWYNLIYPIDTLIHTYQFNPFVFTFSDTLDNIIPGVQIEWEQDITKRVGDWQLFSLKVTCSHLTPESQLSKIMVKAVDSVPTNTFIDDFKMTPYYAISKCFAYDYANKRILHEFDNEHYKTDYIYDDEGKLIRKVKETYRGSKTIAEQYSNIPRENVYQSSGQGSLKNNSKSEELNSKNIRERNNVRTYKSKPLELNNIESEFDIIDIKINESGIHNNLFGIDSLSIEDVYQEVESKVNSLQEKGISVDSLKTDSKFDLNKINLKLEEYDIDKINIRETELKFDKIELDSLNFNKEQMLDSLEKRAIIPKKDVNVNKRVRK
ncbi:MAG: hypothetical protein R2863_12110 [Candidatus Kapaibacterium sp.]